MLLVIAVWGTTATVEAVSLRTLSPLQFTMWSTVFGAVGALFCLIATGSAKELRSFRPPVFALLFVLSMFGFAGYFVLKYTAYSTSPIPQANVLQYTFTLFIVLFAVPVLRQRLSPAKLAGVLVGLLGAAVVLTGGRLIAIERAHITGYLCALGAGISFAVFSVFAEKTTLKRLSALFFYHAYSAVVLFIVLAVSGGLVLPGSPRELAGAFYSGFVSNVLGMLLWLHAQGASKDVSIPTGLLYFVPFVSLACFRVFLGLIIPMSAYVGLALIVGGMFIHTVRGKNERERNGQ